MRNIIFILLLLPLLAKGQAPTPEGQQRGTIKIVGGLKVDSMVFLPVAPLVTWPYASSTIPYIAGVRVNSVDTLPYYIKKAGSFVRFLLASDTLGFLRPADTPAMLAPYARQSQLPTATDILHWNNAYDNYPTSIAFDAGTSQIRVTLRNGSYFYDFIDGRYVRYIDSSAMLANYIRVGHAQPIGNYITGTTGDVVSTGPGSVSATISANAVTYAKMQAVSTTSKLLGSSSTTTPVQEITIGSGLTLLGSTLSAAGGGGSGTVTNVATDATLSGGPITTTGTLGINLSNANTWTAQQTLNNSATTTTWAAATPTVNIPADRVYLGNSNAATASISQLNGCLTIQSNGWKTTGTASVSCEYRFINLPANGSSNPTSRLYVVPYIGGSVPLSTAETFFDSRGNMTVNKIFIGQPSAASNNSNTSIVIGAGAGTNITGAGNIVVGGSSATNITSGTNNTVVGNAAGPVQATAATSSDNICIGNKAGALLQGGAQNNIIISSGTTPGAATITTGTGNVVIGNYAIPSGDRTSTNTMFLSDGAGSLRMKVFSNGNLALNSTTDDGVNLLQVNGSTTTSRITVNTGVSQGSGIKHIRQTTGSISAGSSALVTVTWGSSFADANYTITTSVVDATASTSALSVVHIESQSASAITVRVQNTSAGSLTGTLHVIAIHD